MSDARSDGMVGIVTNALLAAQPDGSTYRYYAENAEWQGPLRQRFVGLRNGTCDVNVEEGLDLLREVNARYNARFPKTRLPAAFDDCARVVNDNHWWTQEPPSLFACHDGEARSLARAYILTVRPSGARGGSKPFSLLSKWLHLCFPDSFVIYDTRVALSVKSWADHDLARIHRDDPDRLQFDLDNHYWTVRWDEPGWYLGLLRFYMLFWETAKYMGVEKDVEAAAARLQDLLREVPDSADARVTPVGVLDCLLWTANGSTQELGLIASG